jgi:hypothetical protein
MSHMVIASGKWTFTGARDIIFFLDPLDTGTRASEFLNMDADDVIQARGDILIQQGKEDIPLLGTPSPSTGPQTCIQQHEQDGFITFTSCAPHGETTAIMHISLGTVITCLEHPFNLLTPERFHRWTFRHADEGPFSSGWASRILHWPGRKKAERLT